MADAALGIAVSFEGVLGEATQITVGAGTQPGAVVTLRGEGMPRLRSEARGDLHAHVEVMVPTKLDARTRELLTEVQSRSTERAGIKSTRTPTAQAGGGGLFSRLRETFTGR
jgi:molecular chaperone DnaJ